MKGVPELRFWTIWELPSLQIWPQRSQIN